MVFTVRTCVRDDPHSAENQVRHGIVPIGISYPKILSDQRVGAKSRPLDDDSECARIPCALLPVEPSPKCAYRRT